VDDLDDRLVALAGQLGSHDPVSRSELEHRVRRVRRRRRAWLGGIASLAAVVMVVSIVAIRGRNQPRQVRVVSPTTVTTSPTARSSVSLPSRYLFNQISVTNGALSLTGEFADTTASTPPCASTFVDPKTLQLRQVREASCNDPTNYGQTIGIVNQHVPNSNNATIRVARIDAHTGHVSEGPVVMVYSFGSTSRPVSVTGGGWLWVFDAAATKGPELLQISASSGNVVNTVTMPPIYRPILAANDDGLWLGPSITGGGPAALYYVASRSHTATVVVPGMIPSAATKRGSITQSVCWLLGDGHALWSGIGPTCAQQTIRRYNHADLQPVFVVPDHGYAPNSVVGDETHGLWTMQWVPPLGTAIPTAAARSQVVVRIDPNTGTEQVAARVPAITFPQYGDASLGLLDGQAAYFRGSLYLLEPPFRQGGYNGYSSLIRVTLPK
jgi:hypothetical protein